MQSHLLKALEHACVEIRCNRTTASLETIKRITMHGTQTVVISLRCWSFFFYHVPLYLLFATTTLRKQHFLYNIVKCEIAVSYEC
jgi:hypothetical protein